MTFKSKIFSPQASEEVSPVELFFNNASSVLSATVREAQSMAEDIQSIATSDVECVTDDEAKAFKSMIPSLRPSKRNDQVKEPASAEIFLSSFSRAFSGRFRDFHSIDEDSDASSDVESYATRDFDLDVDSDVDSIATKDDGKGKAQGDKISNEVQGDKLRDKVQQDEIRDEAQEDKARDDGNRDNGQFILLSDLSPSAVQHEGVKGSHSTLAKQIKKLGKLDQIVKNLEKQVMKYEKQIEMAEKEQEKTMKMMKAHSAGVLPMVEEEPNLLQRFFYDSSGTSEQDKEKLTGNHATLAKQIQNLGKLEQFVKKAEKELMKYEKQLEKAEEEREKTRKMIDALSNKLSIGDEIDDDPVPSYLDDSYTKAFDSTSVEFSGEEDDEEGKAAYRKKVKKVKRYTATLAKLIERLGKQEKVMKEIGEQFDETEQHVKNIKVQISNLKEKKMLGYNEKGSVIEDKKASWW